MEKPVFIEVNQSYTLVEHDGYLGKELRVCASGNIIQMTPHGILQLAEDLIKWAKTQLK